jgi:hypothetical protein
VNSDRPVSLAFTFSEPISGTNVQFNELKSIIKLLEPKYVTFRQISPKRLPNEVPRSKSDIIQVNFKQTCVLKLYATHRLLYRIMKRASYVTSCGPLISTPQLDRATVDTVRDELRDYISNNGINSFELSFFTLDKYIDKAGALSGLLIDQKRSFLCELPFTHAMREILDWNGPGDIIHDGVSDVDARIWVHKDIYEEEISKLPWIYPEKGDELYLVIYQPMYRMRNALHALDETRELKPYWKGIDTTPHKLMGAMLNFAQVDSGQTILEPFAHTGTLLLEAARFDLGKVLYNDKFETIGAKDNLSFLVSPPEKILRIVDELKDITDVNKGENSTPTYRDIRNIALQSIKWENNEAYPQVMDVERLFTNHEWLGDATTRLFYYIVRRFFIENRCGSLDPNGTSRRMGYGRFTTEEEILTALGEFMRNSIARFEEYANLRLRIGEERMRRGIMDIGYSPTDRNIFQYLVDGNDVNIMKDGLPIKQNTIDAIITDPPYGYGSIEEQNEIQFLYRKFFEEAYRVLKPEGRIVICVLDKVRTGKDVVANVMTAGVIDLANTVAKERGVMFLTESIKAFSGDDLLLSYWKAKHKLNRGILSFQVYKGGGAY